MHVMMRTSRGTYSRFIYSDCNNYVYLCNNTSLIECNEIITMIDNSISMHTIIDDYHTLVPFFSPKKKKIYIYIYNIQVCHHSIIQITK